MSSAEAVEEAFQKAVDRALCGVSRQRFAEITADEIASALKELDKLGTTGQEPNYRDRDVALFYSQWYLPEQINVTYSESARILCQGARPGRDELQLVDFGAGTGAMLIGLTLAIATHVRRERWPKRLRGYQIDHPAMLNAGQAMWDAILEEAHGAVALQGLAEVMSRTEVKHLPLDGNLDYAAPPTCEDADRWLTAIHVIYESGMPKINRELRSLRKRIEPHVQIRTAPSAKKHYLKKRHHLELRLEGIATEITCLRATLNRATEPEHDFLDGWVGWQDDDDDILRKEHYATTAWWSGREWRG